MVQLGQGALPQLLIPIISYSQKRKKKKQNLVFYPSELEQEQQLMISGNSLATSSTLDYFPYLKKKKTILQNWQGSHHLSRFKVHFSIDKNSDTKIQYFGIPNGSCTSCITEITGIPFIYEDLKVLKGIKGPPPLYPKFLHSLKENRSLRLIYVCLNKKRFIRSTTSAPS